MKPRTKKLLNFAFIFGTLAIVLLLGVNGQEMSGAIEALKSIGPEWIVLCVLAWVAYLCIDAASVYFFLRRQLLAAMVSGGGFSMSGRAKRKIRVVFVRKM